MEWVFLRKGYDSCVDICVYTDSEPNLWGRKLILLQLRFELRKEQDVCDDVGDGYCTQNIRQVMKCFDIPLLSPPWVDKTEDWREKCALRDWKEGKWTSKNGNNRS